MKHEDARQQEARVTWEHSIEKRYEKGNAYK